MKSLAGISGIVLLVVSVTGFLAGCSEGLVGSPVSPAPPLPCEAGECEGVGRGSIVIVFEQQSAPALQGISAYLFQEISYADVEILDVIYKEIEIIGGKGTLDQDLPVGRYVLSVYPKNGYKDRIAMPTMRAVADVSPGDNEITVSWNSTGLGNIFYQLWWRNAVIFNALNLGEVSALYSSVLGDRHPMLVDGWNTAYNIVLNGLSAEAFVLYNPAKLSLTLKNTTGKTAVIVGEPLSPALIVYQDGEYLLTPIAPGGLWKILVEDESAEKIMEGYFWSGYTTYLTVDFSEEATTSSVGVDFGEGANKKIINAPWVQIIGGDIVNAGDDIIRGTEGKPVNLIVSARDDKALVKMDVDSGNGSTPTAKDGPFPPDETGVYTESVSLVYKNAGGYLPEICFTDDDGLRTCDTITVIITVSSSGSGGGGVPVPLN